jgi:hypothetical protein
MKISRHKTRDVFYHYHLVDTEDVVEAMRRLQGKVPSKGLVSGGGDSAKTANRSHRQMQLTK